MDTTVFIARIFGLSYIIIALGLMLNRKAYQKVMEDFSKSAGMIFYSGILALVIGLVIILNHNIWVANWTVAVTLLGWAGLIKGIWLIIFPERASKVMQVYLKNKSLLVIHSFVALILGIALTIVSCY